MSLAIFGNSDLFNVYTTFKGSHLRVLWLNVHWASESLLKFFPITCPSREKDGLGVHRMTKWFPDDLEHPALSGFFFTNDTNDLPWAAFQPQQVHAWVGQASCPMRRCRQLSFCIKPVPHYLSKNLLHQSNLLTFKKQKKLFSLDNILLDTWTRHLYCLENVTPLYPEWFLCDFSFDGTGWPGSQLTICGMDP